VSTKIIRGYILFKRYDFFIIFKRIYVDVLLIGADSKQETVTKLKEIIHTATTYKFPLRKPKSKLLLITTSFPKELTESPSTE
jgi:hypothetical protein